VVTVTLGFHRRVRIHFEDLQLEQDYSGTASYSQSKLANVRFTYEPARRLNAVFFKLFGPGAGGGDGAVLP
jgi:hypothetical protein